MSEKQINWKTNLVNLLVIIFLVVIFAVLLFGLLHQSDEEVVETSTSTSPSLTTESYQINGRTLAEFSEVIVEKFREESKLVVSAVDATVSMELKQSAGWDIDILTKTQKVSYKGTGSFYIDLSTMGAYSLSLDEVAQVITIQIPHAKMEPLEIDPTKFTCEKVENGWLAFGELKFTPQEFNQLQTTCKTMLEQEIHTPENLKKADEYAIKEMTKLYEPVVKAIDDGYGVEIRFIE